MAALMVVDQDDSDSEYQDAQEDFHHINGGAVKKLTHGLQVEVPSPGPVAPPRVKRNRKKQLEKERTSSRDPGEGQTKGILHHSSKPCDVEQFSNALTVEQMVDTQDSFDSDPSVTIMEEGLQMNPELLQTSQVTVTSDTPMKRSGRVASEYKESVVSSSDSGEESAGRDGDGTLKEVEPMDRSDAKSQRKETDGAQASLSDSVSLVSLGYCRAIHTKGWLDGSLACCHNIMLQDRNGDVT